MKAARSKEDRRVYLIEGEMRIEVNQLPPAECSPNARIHWAKRYRAAEVYRGSVFYECVSARNIGLLEGRSFPIARAQVHLTFVFGCRRRRDEDNLLARFKPGLDGIVQSGLIMDDDVNHLEISGLDILTDLERAPLTIIDIEEIKKLKGESDGAEKG